MEPGYQALPFQHNPTQLTSLENVKRQTCSLAVSVYAKAQARVKVMTTSQDAGSALALAVSGDFATGSQSCLLLFPSQGAKELAPTLADPCKAGMLKAGTLQQLVDHLVPALLFGDPMDIPIFLCTYRRFATTQQVLDLLLTRYDSFLYSTEDGGPQEQVKQAMSFIVGTWLKQYSEDFTEPLNFPCLKKLVNYLQVNMPGSDEENHAKLLLAQMEHLAPSKEKSEALSPSPVLCLRTTPQVEHIEAPFMAHNPIAKPPSDPELVSSEDSESESILAPALEREPTHFLPSQHGSCPAPASELDPAYSYAIEFEQTLSPFSSRDSSWESLVSTDSTLSEEEPSILFFPPQLVAEQLTLMDAELFKKVVPYHCLDYICTHWKKDDKGHVAPTIQATVTHFHKVTTCVITTCLGDQSMEAADRAKVVEHWIAVAWECRALNNFSSLCAIVAALHSKAIHRLRKTWKDVSSNSLQIFQSLSSVLTPETIYCLSKEGLVEGETSKWATMCMNIKRRHGQQERVSDHAQNQGHPGSSSGDGSTRPSHLW
ncbi:ral guanine nucleotide dissociation stimulator-like [Castor canadensis]|uniref:Ral guanine nucleotide dissociation stimulator-like n=1 Tax=Castor canadensis TaxID=51338 RepID=A0AC58LAJ7_CASCN